MKALEIHLKSGATFTVDAIDVSTTRQADELTALKWTNTEGAKRKLHGFYNLSEIVALVVIR